MGSGAFVAASLVALMAVGSVFFGENLCCLMGTLSLNNIFYEDNSIEKQVAHAWKKAIQSPKIQFKRIAVGLNGDVDLIVQGSELLMTLDPKSNSSSEESIDHSSLGSIKDLRQTFKYFLSKGAGGERFMDNLNDFRDVLKAAKSIKSVEYYVGGNAALMANSLTTMMGTLGNVTLGAPVGPKLKPLLHQKLHVAKDLQVDEDEYHMILEYQKGERWAGVEAPIASRFIFSHDKSNSEMKAFELFLKSLKDFKPDLLVISGFHLLESNSVTFWEKRILQIADLLKEIPKSLPIHVELASMSSDKCMGEIIKQILPLVDSIGLNEQELWMICKIGGGPHCAKGSLPGPPAVAVASDVIHWMIDSLASAPGSRLTRVHFHTLTYHVAATVESSPWDNQLAAVVAGTRIAATQACDDSVLVPSKVELRLSGEFAFSADPSQPELTRVRELNPQDPFVSWRRSAYEFNFSPVLVCRRPVKTVGLGDAISATGLFYSEFNGS